MKKYSLFIAIAAFCALCGSAWAITKTPAKDITVETASFNKNLSSDDDTVQKALKTINDIPMAFNVNWQEVDGLSDQLDLKSDKINTVASVSATYPVASSGGNNPNITIDLSAYLTDAPNDGNQYARKDLNWTVITQPITGVNWIDIGGSQSDINVGGFTNDAGYVTGTPWTSEGYITDAPSDGSTYGRKDGTWAVASVDLSGYVAKTDVKTIKIDGDFYAQYLVSTTKKITPTDLGFGYTITRVVVQAATASPTTQFRGDLKRSDAQGTGAFPGANPAVIKVLDTTTGNYDSGVIAEDVATGKELYIQMDSNVDYGVMWTITITYNLKTS